MLLKRKQNAAADKKQPQEQFSKIRTFSGSFGAPSSAAGAVSGRNSIDPPASGNNLPESLSEEKNNPGFSGSAENGEIEMQDTIWSEDRYLIRFVDDRGRLLYSCELSYGEKPVFRGERPVKTDDGCAWSFAGWEPEIAPATADRTYTALFSEVVSPEPEAEPETQSIPGPVDEPDEEDIDDSFYEEADPVSGNEWKPEFTNENTPDDESVPEYEYEEGSSDPDDEPAFLSRAEDEKEEDVGPEFIPDPSGKLFPVLETRGKTALTASWKPVENIDGYDVFFSPCGSDFGSPFKTLSSEETALTFSGLKKKTAYKMKIRAFLLRHGQKSYVCDSFTLRSITGGVSGQYTNAKKIRTKHSRLELTVGERKKLSAEVTGQDPGRRVLSRGGMLRFLSGSPKVAAVAKDGKLLAVSPGTCKIRIIAQNGINDVLEAVVRENSETVAFKKKKYTLEVGSRIDLKKKLKAGHEMNAPLKWKSSDRQIAEVSRKGVVTALKKGKTKVRVKASGGIRTKVRIRVNPSTKMMIPWESVGFLNADKKRPRKA